MLVAFLSVAEDVQVNEREVRINRMSQKRIGDQLWANYFLMF